MIREGHGIVHLRGDSYEGAYRIDGEWVTLDGRHRKPQAGGDILYGRRRTWTWPARRVRAIVEHAEADR